MLSPLFYVIPRINIIVILGKLVIKMLIGNTQPKSCKLSILLACYKQVKIRLVAICHLQTCYNLLKQVAASLWITSLQNQLATTRFILI